MADLHAPAGKLIPPVTADLGGATVAMVSARELHGFMDAGQASPAGSTNGS